MNRAISTRWQGPTTHKGSRVKAIARKREGDLPELSLTDGWNYGTGMEENHCRVAQLLAVKMNWHGLYVGGGSPDDMGFTFVSLPNGVSPQSIAGHTLSRHPLGVEGRDWFYVPETIS